MGIKFTVDEAYQEVLLGLNAYKHHKDHPWVGFTVQVVVGKWCVSADIILKGYKKFLWEMYKRYETL